MARRIGDDPDNTQVSAVLAALPLEESRFSTDSVDVDVSTNISSKLKIAAIIGLVLALVVIFPVVLLGVIPVILALLNPLGTVVSIGVVVGIGVAVSAGLAWLISKVVEARIERGMEQNIRDNFPFDTIRNSLGSIVLYSGEGLGSLLRRGARRGHRAGNDPNER